MESNALWQEVNKQLGVNLKLNLNSQADYQSVKLPTIIAGDDLPDILYIAPGTVIAGLPKFLQAKCADLTPYLSGDAVKDYPNLANFPTLAWQGVVFNKAIYGVPAPYPLFLWVHWVHQELLDADSLQQPKNLDEYKSLLKHFTDPQQDRYGLATENTNGYGITNGFFTAMYGVPNTWGVDAAGQTDGRRRDRPVQGRDQHRARAVGGRRVLAELAAIQHWHRAHRLRGAQVRVPLRRFPGRLADVFQQRAEPRIRRASTASCRHSRRRRACSRPTGRSRAFSATACSRRPAPSASRSSCAC